MKVKNVNGTSGRSCKCGSWLEHWNNFNSGQIANRCRAKGCSNEAEVGAHVHKQTDNREFIVPFCKGHNAQKYPIWIELNTGTDCVPASRLNTCKY